MTTPQNKDPQPGDKPTDVEISQRMAATEKAATTAPGGQVGPGLLETAGSPPDLGDDGGAPPTGTPVPAEIPSVRLARPASAATTDQNLWTLIRNRTNAIQFNNYYNYVNAVLSEAQGALGSTSTAIQDEVANLSFLGLDGYEVLRAITEYFLMHEVGLIVEDPYRGLTAENLQKVYDQSMRIGPGTDPTQTSEYRRRNYQPLPANWLVNLRDSYLENLATSAQPKVLPYLKVIMDKLADLPLKQPGETGGAGAYGVLPSRLVGPLGLELIWSYWLEEGMVVQAHNAVTNRFQNQRVAAGAIDPLSRLEIDPLRRMNNVLWGWVQARPFLLSVRRRAYEYDHQYGMTLLGKAVGEVDGADSRSQFISSFHHLLHLATMFYQQDDDLTVQADGFPLLNALRETQLVVTAGADNQYGDLPWTARVEMLIQMWMFARPEMREFLGGRIMVPYKEPWMDRVDAVKNAMNWTDVNVTHFRDLGTFGEQIVLSIRYGSWSTEIEPDAAVNWARYWRPEIQGYVHAYRAATGADLRSGVDTTMPGSLLERRLAEQLGTGSRRAALTRTGRPAMRRATASRNVRELT